MADNSDLFQGLQMLNDGIKQFKVGRAIDKAQTEINALNEAFERGSINEIEMQQAQSRAANFLVANMTSFGADANDTAMAFKALAPKIASTEQELLFQAKMGEVKKLGPTGTVGELYTRVKKAVIDSERDVEEIKYGTQKNLVKDKLSADLSVESFKKRNLHASYQQPKDGDSKEDPFDKLELIPGKKWKSTLVKPNSAEQTKIRSDYNAMNAFLQVLKQYRNYVKKHGTEYGLAKGREGEVLFESLVFKVKDLEALGALQAPDIQQIRKLIPESANPIENIKSTLSLGATTEGIIKSLDSLDGITKRGFEAKYSPFLEDSNPQPRNRGNPAIRTVASEDGPKSPNTRSRHVTISAPLAQKAMEIAEKPVQKGSIRSQEINKAMTKLANLMGVKDTLSKYKNTPASQKRLQSLEDEINKEKERLNSLKKGR